MPYKRGEPVPDIDTLDFLVRGGSNIMFKSNIFAPAKMRTMTLSWMQDKLSAKELFLARERTL